MKAWGLGLGGVALGALATTVVSCSPPRICTQLAAVPGVRVQIEPEATDGLTAAFLRICEPAACRDYDLVNAENRLGSPDGLAASVPTPLTDTSMKLTVTLVRGGREEAFTLMAKPKLVQPNGEGCGGDALRFELILDDALRVA